MNEPARPEKLDTLEDLLDGLEVVVEPFAVCVVSGSTPLDMPPRDAPVLHYTLAGHGRLKLRDQGEIRVRPRTVLIVPARTRQRLMSASPPADRANPVVPGCAPLTDGWERVCAGSGAPEIQMACAEIRATYQQVHGVFDYLTDPIVEQVEAGDAIDIAMQSLLKELAAPGAGTRVLARALMQQCLVLLMRRQAAAGPWLRPWLGPVKDPRLGRAMAAMLERPEDPHTVESLACLAGMSRSTFAEHFTENFGRGPIDLLKDVRLRHAARLLRATDQPIKQVAGRIGYRSRSYFSRAFKKLFAVSPAAYRDQPKL